MDRQQLEQQLAALPLFQYEFIMPEELTFSERIRHVCESECPMYNTTWACPPAVGTPLLQSRPGGGNHLAIGPAAQGDLVWWKKQDPQQG